MKSEDLIIKSLRQTLGIKKIESRLMMGGTLSEIYIQPAEKLLSIFEDLHNGSSSDKMISTLIAIALTAYLTNPWSIDILSFLAVEELDRLVKMDPIEVERKGMIARKALVNKMIKESGG